MAHHSARTCGRGAHASYICYGYVCARMLYVLWICLRTPASPPYTIRLLIPMCTGRSKLTHTDAKTRSPAPITTAGYFYRRRFSCTHRWVMGWLLGVGFASRLPYTSIGANRRAWNVVLRILTCVACVVPWRYLVLCPWVPGLMPVAVPGLMPVGACC